MTSGGSGTALRRILADGFDSALAPGGFARDGRRQVWIRPGEVSHVVAVVKRYGRFSTQWGVYAPELADLLFGEVPEPIDVGYSFITGHTESIIDASADVFSIDDSGRIRSARQDLSVDAFVPAVHHDMVALGTWLAPLRTRRDARSYLLANRDSTDSRGFVVPAKLPLKLLVCAGLAALDRDPEATEMAEEAITALQPWNRDGKDARIARLRALTS